MLNKEHISRMSTQKYFKFPTLPFAEGIPEIQQIKSTICATDSCRIPNELCVEGLSCIDHQTNLEHIHISHKPLFMYIYTYVRLLLSRNSLHTGDT